MEIDSPIGKTRFNSTDDGMKTFSVPDDSEVVSGPQELTAEEAMARRAQFARQAEAHLAKKPDATAVLKERVEFLTGISRRTTTFTVEVDGKKSSYSLRTLKGREQRELANYMQTIVPTIVDGVEKVKRTDLMNLKKIALKYSIFAIDDIDINVVLGVSDLNVQNQLLAREYFLDELDDTYSDFLYFKYQEMVNDHNNKFAIKNEQDAREVAEAVRKSS